MSKKFLISTLTAAGLALSLGLNAEETTGEKVKTMKNKTEDSAKEATRKAADKGCEMIHGKLECAGQKMKHKAKTMKEKTETKVVETKDKID